MMRFRKHQMDTVTRYVVMGVYPGVLRLLSLRTTI